MELIFATRGKTNEVDEFVKWMSTRHLPMPVKAGDGKISTGFLECQLRPIQLWEFVFPKENLDTVLNSLHLPSGNPSGVNPETGKQKFNNFLFEAELLALRKMLQAKPIPEVVPKKDPVTGKELPKDFMFLPYDRIKDLNIIGIGIREDGEISENTHERI